MDVFPKILQELMDDNNAVFGALRHILGYHDQSYEKYCCGFFEIVNRVPAVLQEIGEVIYSEADPVGTFVKYLPFFIYVVFSDIKIMRLKSRITSLKKEPVDQKMQKDSSLEDKGKQSACLTGNKSKKIIGNNMQFFARAEKTRENPSSDHKKVRLDLAMNRSCKSCLKLKKTTGKSGQSIVTASPNRRRTAQLLQLTVNPKKQALRTKSKGVQVDLPSRPGIPSFNTTETCLMKKAIAMNYISTSYVKIIRSKSRVQPAKESLLSRRAFREIADSGKNHCCTAEPNSAENAVSAIAPAEFLSKGSAKNDASSSLKKKILARNQETMERVLEGNTPLFQVQQLLGGEFPQSRPIRHTNRSTRSPPMANHEIFSEIKYFEFKTPQDPEKMFFGMFYNRFSGKPERVHDKELSLEAVSLKMGMKRLSQNESMQNALTHGLQSPREFRGLGGNRAIVSPVAREMMSEGDNKASPPSIAWRIKDRERFKRYRALLKQFKTPQASTRKMNFTKSEETIEFFNPQPSIVSTMGPTVSLNDRVRVVEGTPMKPAVDEETESKMKKAPCSPTEQNINLGISEPKPVPPRVNITPDSIKPCKYNISDLFKDRINHQMTTHFLRSTQNRSSRLGANADAGQGDVRSRIPKKTPIAHFEKSASSEVSPIITCEFQKTEHNFEAEPTQRHKTSEKVEKAFKTYAETPRGCPASRYYQRI